ncbi:MAG TPA: hypothetical protein DEQ03_08585 [Marinilabiliales bacterium]|nr:hypothetical protein [Marinilabiliales bacterium]
MFVRNSKIRHPFEFNLVHPASFIEKVCCIIHVRAIHLEGNFFNIFQVLPITYNHSIATGTPGQLINNDQFGSRSFKCFCRGIYHP